MPPEQLYQVKNQYPTAPEIKEGLNGMVAFTVIV